MDWKKEIKETIIYVFVGLVLATVINQGLGFALETSRPVMAVVSGSMEPTFYRGDLVVVNGIYAEDIEVGDIIVYDNPYRGIPVVHRVIEIKETEDGLEFYTKGDNIKTNYLSDQQSGIAPPIRQRWIRGKVVLVIPKLGWLRVMLTEIY
ncbi:MAG: signal peptidase I [Candidatus Hydrothermarchaeaceae archaeon]